MNTIGKILAIIGLVVLAFATIGSVGYGLYLWGGIGIAFSVSVWTAFVVWLKAVGSGLLLVSIGLLMGAYK